ncbi:MAG TPA: hypothetical protein VNL14_05730 [Candidatus Acidoferrales bacterium]|nr:hypothetical protein [Candidatus Acidoferrales bacterium]
MSKEILVAMKSQDRIQDILPCLEKVAQPGTKVTFLIKYPVDGFIRSNEDELFSRSLAETQRLAKHYSWEENVKRAEKKVSPALETLRGVEVAAEVYAGSLKKAIKSHATKGTVNLVMTRAGIGQWIAGLFNGMNPVLRLLKRPSFSPVLLIQPRTLS